jgi:hypothetical protein
MTEPLTPPDCDLRDYPWMPLDCTRLLTSETWMLGTSDEKVAALTLWCKSWHQAPAGSLPNNDRMLGVLSEAGSKWPKVRDHALRGWVLCSDGRLYHPVVAEKANYSWELKLKQKARTQAARDALDAKRRAATAPPTVTVTATVTEPVAESVTGSIRTELIRTEQNVSSSGERAPRSASPPRPERGSRLPADWQPSEPGYEGASAQTLARFRDYWLAQPGQRGVKTDWQATWRNWCRRDAEDRKRAPPAKTSALSTYDQNEALIRLAREATPELRMIG